MTNAKLPQKPWYSHITQKSILFVLGVGIIFHEAFLLDPHIEPRWHIVMAGLGLVGGPILWTADDVKR